VSLTRPLMADLHDLVLDLTIGCCDTITAEMLRRDLTRLVPSSLGVSVVLVPPLAPCGGVFLHLLDRVVEPDEVQAWLQVDLCLFSPGLPGRATFYAAERGGLDELARELETTLCLDAGELDQTAAPLDGPLVPGICGLDDLTVVNRAVGILLHRGLTMDAARQELQRRARDTQASLSEVARALLDGAT
jgi:hypothetical protein